PGDVCGCITAELGGNALPSQAAGTARARSTEHLEQDPLLHPRDLADALQVGVPHDRVRDGSDRRHEGVDEAGLAARRLEVVRLRVDVDQVLDDRLRGPDLLAPEVWRGA